MWRLSPTGADVGEPGWAGGQVGIGGPELRAPPAPQSQVDWESRSCPGGAPASPGSWWDGRPALGGKRQAWVTHVHTLIPHSWGGVDTSRCRHAGRVLSVWKEASGVSKKSPLLTPNSRCGALGLALGGGRQMVPTRAGGH